MKKSSLALRGTVTAALFGMGLGLSSMGATAAEETEMMTPPEDQDTCMTRVEDLRGEASNIGNSALIVAFADEAEDACESENYDNAQAALSDGYRWLDRKQGEGK